MLCRTHVNLLKKNPKRIKFSRKTQALQKLKIYFRDDLRSKKELTYSIIYTFRIYKIPKNISLLLFFKIFILKNHFI
ncbi:hypothetical protein LEP1GSC074_1317 [Leptospira noguchii str. Hook]|nr:hypothetical protein LEP1GSC074_1317 [Leptospira noguchii str. Hook]